VSDVAAAGHDGGHTDSAVRDPSVQTSMAVMHGGQTLSNDLMHELATTVATTAQRERLRKRTSMVLAGVGAVVVPWVYLTEFSGETIPFAMLGMLCLLPLLPLHLAWGVRNRALLNAAAAAAAVDHKALAAAVVAVERNKLGPSMALQVALQKHSTKAR